MTRRAFTLIEIIVAVAIVGILLAITAGSLSALRERGRRATSLSNLRTHAQVFSVYTNEYAGCFPYFTDVGFASTTLKGGGVELAGVSYFGAHHTWHVALADGYYTGDVKSDVFYPPQFDLDGHEWWPYQTPYHYGCVFIANAQYWNQYTRIGPQQYQATRADSVRFPASKAMIVQSWPFTRDVAEPDDQLSNELPVALCDGSAQQLTWRDRMNGYDKGDGYQFREDGAIHYTDWPPLLHTIDGVHGRDVR
ncbi:MAG: type II secretion system protein [Phycisphaerales bacterium]|nr:type II secretion system protein [Phycisphaerales bacterium]